MVINHDHAADDSSEGGGGGGPEPPPPPTPCTRADAHAQPQKSAPRRLWEYLSTLNSTVCLNRSHALRCCRPTAARFGALACSQEPSLEERSLAAQLARLDTQMEEEERSLAWPPQADADVAGMGPVSVQMWQGRAQSGCTCGGG